MKLQTITIQGSHVAVLFTPLQAVALCSLVEASNGYGDHEQWSREAGATRHEIRAMRECMAIADWACYLGRRLLDRTTTKTKAIRK